MRPLMQLPSRPSCHALAGSVQEIQKVNQSIVYGAFARGMRDLGYIEGRDFIAERRFWGNDDHSALTYATKDLVHSRVDIIVSSGTTAVRSVQAATRTIPIVMTAVGDPISSGLVAALARPGGNTTGLSILSKELAAKRIELIKEVRPESRRLAVIENPNNSLHVLTTEQIASTASSLGLVMRAFPFLQPEEYNRTFVSMSQWPADLGIVLDEGIFVVNRALIAAAAISVRLPLACVFREMAEAGCLISYSPHLLDIHYRAASFVVKILKGPTSRSCPSSNPQRSSSWSISKPRKRSASNYQDRYSPAPTRSSNEKARVHRGTWWWGDFGRNHKAQPGGRAILPGASGLY
jgi:ABC-type uncharacterized transport system substrate-binding protein